MAKSEVINFDMKFHMKSNKTQGHPKVHSFSTFHSTTLKSGGYKSVQRWTQVVNLFAKEIIIVPIHLDVHWSLLVIDPQKMSIVCLNL